MDFAFVVAVILGLVNCILLVLLLRRRTESQPLEPLISQVEKSNERTERTVKDEISRNREETNTASRQTREELNLAVKAFGESLFKQMTQIAAMQKGQLDTFSNQLVALTQSNEQKLDKFSTAVTLLTQSNEQQLGKVRETVENRLMSLQADNTAKLEAMRQTVDEKLHATLEQRLGESFKLVSERLELVHKGLGEMQSLAHGVGDLKKVLTNIKTRGNWGEVQLGNLLEQMFTPDQYSANVQVNPQTNERVEFAIKLPGRDGAGRDGMARPIWLPIDAKFPQEDYQRLVSASETGDTEAVAASSTALQDRICLEAKKIKEKYICPPHSTDFAILFLPTEGLFAEVLRRPGLCDGLLHDHRVVLAGPTTLAAVLSSLQMGFRTLAIEQRSSEVWQVLGAVKTEFGKFGDVLERVQKKLQEASNTVDQAATRSRVLAKKLKDVQELPQEQSDSMLQLPEDTLKFPGIHVEDDADEASTGT
jgi:DNA recombination protein RmuC